MALSDIDYRRLALALGSFAAADDIQNFLGQSTGTGANPKFNNMTLLGLLTESPTDNITAFSGGGQSSAVLLTTEVNRVTTAAASGDSVALPPSAPGLTIYVINHGANPIGVYGQGSDTIDDVAAATGVTQMQGSLVLYACTTAGKWYSNGLSTGYSGSFQTESSLNGIVAHSGGGQGSATPLTAMLNRITTVAAGNDSVLLPAAVVGLQIVVINAAAANSANVFPTGTDAINALGASAAFALAAAKVATFYCVNAGQWHSILTA